MNALEKNLAVARGEALGGAPDGIRGATSGAHGPA
jgi:hypothetical protein